MSIAPRTGTDEGASAQTDAEGAYRVDVPFGEVGFVLQAVGPRLPCGTEGHGRFDAVGEPFSAGEERRLDIQLSRGLGFVLTLTRSDTGQPLDGVARLVYICPHVSGDPCQAIAVSDQFIHGAYETGGIDPERFRLQDTVLQVSRGSTTVLFPLKSFPVIDGRYRVSSPFPVGLSIRGLVLGPDGRPYGKAGCQIEHGPASKGMTGELVTLAADGSFLLDYLPASETEYLINVRGMTDAILPEPARVRAGSQAVLRLEEGWRLSGRVLDAEGRPVPGGSVLAWFGDEGPASRRWVAADAQGVYTLPPLPKRPRLSVAAFPAGLECFTWMEGRDPVGGGDLVQGCGWRDLPPGLPLLDLTLDPSAGIRPYPSGGP